MSSPQIAIDVADVSRAFGRTRAVDRASVRIPRGQIAALIGPSGSGKTTLLRMVAGFETPDEGRIRIDGREVAGPGVFVEPDVRRIGMVFQDGALFPHLDVTRNLAFSGASAARVAECLELVGLADRADAYPHELSGGERQRIALARALAADPAVVLLDEPFAALDESLRTHLREQVAAILRAAGATALLVTHHQEEALSLADQVVVMRDGRVAQDGTPEEVYARPATRWVAEFLGDADVLPGTAGGGVAECELGAFAVDAGRTGAVEVVLRPEQLAITPGGADGSSDGRVAARVRRRSYFGHDQLLELELASGTGVRCRLPGGTVWRPGDAVDVRVLGDVTVLDA